MIISVVVGVLSGVLGVACWWLTQFLLNSASVAGFVSGQWYLIPPAIGALAAFLYSVTRLRVDKRQALADLFEGYHLGIFKLPPLKWGVRGIISLSNAIFGGTFGFEGGILELTYSCHRMLSRYFKLFIEEKQAFTICTLSSAVGVAFGAPFSGALVGLEIVHALEARVRAGVVLATLIAYGTAIVLRPESTTSISLLSSLFEGFKPLNFERSQLVMISGAAVILGVCIAFFAAFTSRMLVRGSEFFSQLSLDASRFNFFAPALMIGTGLLIGFSVWLSPESLSEPWRIWEDVAWLRLTSIGALIILFAKWGILVLAFSGWGSSGLFSPMLLIGALLGYIGGNAIASSWALPLAIAGASAMLSATFRVPVAAAALVLEVGHDGPMWWLAISAVLSATLVSKLLGYKPLQELMLERRGMRLIGGRAANLLEGLRVFEAMDRDIKTIHDDSTIHELREAVNTSVHGFLGVVSKDGKYLGVLSIEQLPSRLKRVLKPEATAFEIQTVDRIVEIRDIMDVNNPNLLPEDTLERAIELLQSAPCIAVVDSERHLKGLVFESSIAGRYKREVSKRAIHGS